MNTLIMKSNYHQIEEFIDFAKGHGFDQISLMALHFDLAPDENIFYENKDFKALRFITKSIPRIKEKAEKYNIELDILLPTEDLELSTFESQDETIHKNNNTLYCKIPWKYMFICDKGTVYLAGPCLKSIGNIYKNSLDEIWNNRESQIYRENLLKNKFQGICRSECLTRWEI